MSESDLQSACIDAAKTIGCWAIPNIVVRHRKRPTGLGTGSPDLLVVIPGCPRGTEILFAELKTESGKRSVDQVKWHDQAKRLGLRVETIRSVTQLLATITAIRFGRAA